MKILEHSWNWFTIGGKLLPDLVLSPSDFYLIVNTKGVFNQINMHERASDTEVALLETTDKDLIFIRKVNSHPLRNSIKTLMFPFAEISTAVNIYLHKETHPARLIRF